MVLPWVKGMDVIQGGGNCFKKSRERQMGETRIGERTKKRAVERARYLGNGRGFG